MPAEVNHEAQAYRWVEDGLDDGDDSRCALGWSGKIHILHPDLLGLGGTQCIWAGDMPFHKVRDCAHHPTAAST